MDPFYHFRVSSEEQLLGRCKDAEIIYNAVPSIQIEVLKPGKSIFTRPSAFCCLQIPISFLSLSLSLSLSPPCLLRACILRFTISSTFIENFVSNFSLEKKKKEKKINKKEIFCFQRIFHLELFACEFSTTPNSCRFKARSKYFSNPARRNLCEIPRDSRGKENSARNLDDARACIHTHTHT